MSPLTPKGGIKADLRLTTFDLRLLTFDFRLTTFDLRLMTFDFRLYDFRLSPLRLTTIKNHNRYRNQTIGHDLCKVDGLVKVKQRQEEMDQRIGVHQDSNRR
ncbi:MAG: hypothetical protein RLZZ500_2616 [Bacteroidota bacterium]